VYEYELLRKYLNFREKYIYEYSEGEKNAFNEPKLHLKDFRNSHFLVLVIKIKIKE
jgi:hypothetical protein